MNRAIPLPAEEVSSTFERVPLGTVPRPPDGKLIRIDSELVDDEIICERLLRARSYERDAVLNCKVRAYAAVVTRPPTRSSASMTCTDMPPRTSRRALLVPRTQRRQQPRPRVIKRERRHRICQRGGKEECAKAAREPLSLIVLLQAGE